MLTQYGLAIICIAWLYQLYSLKSSGDKSLTSAFAGIYSLGVLLLVVDGFMQTANSITYLNLLSLIGSAGVFFTVCCKKE